MKKVGFIDLKRSPGNEEDQSFLRGLKIFLLKNNFRDQEQGSKKLEHPTVISPQHAPASLMR